MRPREPRRRHAGDGHPAGRRRRPGDRRRVHPPRSPSRAGDVRRGDPLWRRVQLAATAAGVGDRRRRAPAVGRRRRASPPAGRRPAPAGPPRGVRAARQHAAGVAQPVAAEVALAVDRHAVAGPAGTGCVQPLRGRRLHPQQRRRRLPEPDVPLPADRRPLRRLRSGGRARLPGAHRADVLRLRAARCSIRSPDVSVKPALRFNYLSTAQDRREWVEAIRHARHILAQPAFAPFDGGELSPGPSVETDEDDPRLGRPRRRDGAAPVVHVPDGRRRRVGARPRHVACARTPRASGSSMPRRCRTSPTATSTPR